MKRLSGLRVMVIGAHPDDPDVYAAGTAVKYVSEGARVVFLSLTNGDKGHRELSPPELAARRKGEAKHAAETLGIEDYLVLDHPDCELEATLENRWELIRIIRKFAPHVIFTHRTCDYHADHRACGTLVMDATYLLGVPHCCPDTPIPNVAPVVFFLRDIFTVPREFRCDVAVDVGAVKDVMADGLLCHVSQFLEWLPPENEGAVEALPKPGAPVEERRAFVRRFWHDARQGQDVKRFDLPFEYAECFELSEYGRTPSASELQGLFPAGTQFRIAVGERGALQNR
ncbi:MAG: PIG-L family deacetylase [Kiritimatiellae bacterium]|nr:PIG-L family deacetylase [Kiritimatiellia bacterium]